MPAARWSLPRVLVRGAAAVALLASPLAGQTAPGDNLQIVEPRSMTTVGVRVPICDRLGVDSVGYGIRPHNDVRILGRTTGRTACGDSDRRLPVTFQIPGDAAAGRFHALTVLWDGDVEPSPLYLAVRAHRDLRISLPDSLVWVQPGQVTQIPFTVTNQGNGRESVRVEVEADAMYGAVVGNPGQRTLEPGAEARGEIQLHPAGHVPPGPTQEITLRVVGDGVHRQASTPVQILAELRGLASVHHLPTTLFIGVTETGEQAVSLRGSGPVSGDAKVELEIHQGTDRPYAGFGRYVRHGDRYRVRVEHDLGTVEAGDIRVPFNVGLRLPGEARGIQMERQWNRVRLQGGYSRVEVRQGTGTVLNAGLDLRTVPLQPRLHVAQFNGPADSLGAERRTVGQLEVRRDLPGRIGSLNLTVRGGEYRRYGERERGLNYDLRYAFRLPQTRVSGMVQKTTFAPNGIEQPGLVWHTSATVDLPASLRAHVTGYVRTPDAVDGETAPYLTQTSGYFNAGLSANLLAVNVNGNLGRTLIPDDAGGYWQQTTTGRIGVPVGPVRGDVSITRSGGGGQNLRGSLRWSRRGGGWAEVAATRASSPDRKPVTAFTALAYTSFGALGIDGNLRFSPDYDWRPTGLLGLRYDVTRSTTLLVWTQHLPYREARPWEFAVGVAHDLSLPTPLPRTEIRPGRVFLDANGNGVPDPGERGLSGVTIFVDGHQAVSDGHGRIRVLRALDPARIRGDLQSLPPGHLIDVRHVRLVGGDIMIPVREAARVHLTFYEDEDENGRLSEMDSRASSVIVSLEGMGTTRLVTTGADGVIRQTGLVPGEYALRHRRRIWGNEWFEETRRITLGPGEALRMNLAVPAAGRSIRFR